MLGLLKRCRDDARQNTARHARDKADLQNLFLKRGGPDHAWTVWDNDSGTYVPRPYEGEGSLPDWFPRPSTNTFSNKIDGIAALLNQSQPALEWKPSTDDDQDLAAADVIENAMPTLLEEVDWDSLKGRINKLITLTDKVAVVVYYDNDPKHGMESIPAYQCAACGEYTDAHDLPDEPAADLVDGANGAALDGGQCPTCGEGPLAIAQDPKTGKTIGKDYPKGKLCADHYLSFETSLPRSARLADETKLPWILTHSRHSKEEAVGKWPELREELQRSGGGGRTGSAEAKDAYADQARNLSAPTGNPGTTGAGATAGQGPVIYRLWHDPIDDGEFCFPEGLYVVCHEEEKLLETDDGKDSGQPMYGQPLPLVDGDGRPVKNVLIRQYQHSPGSPWGKPPADDLAQLQILENLAIALAFLILMHHAAPRTFIPSTVTLLDDMVNQPGATVGYRSLNGEKPFTEPGQGFPEALKWFLEYLKTQFDELSNLNAVLQGARPSGDPTLGEIQILTERGMSAFRETLDALVSFEKRFARMLLWTARQSAWAPRFRRTQGDNGEWEFQQFTAADLTGNVDVFCEQTSAWPRSVLLQNKRLEAAFNLKVLNPQDPEVAQQFLSLNDLTEFKKSNDVDRKQVARQLDMWRHAQSPQAIVPPQLWWSLPTHLFLKSQFLKTEEAEAIQQTNPAVYQAMVAHVQQLHAMMQPPAPAPGPTPPSGKVLDAAVSAGKLRPKGPPGSGGTLNQAVKQGVLRPKSAAAPAATGARRPPAAPPANPAAPSGGVGV